MMGRRELAKFIGEMVKIDQEARKLGPPSAGKLGIHNYLVYIIDAVHNYRIWKIINEHGFPSHKTVGMKAMRDFWLLIQHQDHDVALQEQCFEQCDFRPKEHAYLTDRVLVNKGKKQIYGTQFYQKGGTLVPRPILNSKDLCKRREKAGFEPFSKYQKTMLKNYHSISKKNK